MTESQDVLERTRRRRRRHAPAILLGGVPVLVAATALAGAYTVAPTTAAYAADVEDSAPVTSADPVSSIAAAEVEEGGFAPKVTVKLPPPPEPEPEPEPEPVANTPSSSGSTSSGSTSSGSTSSGSTTSSGSSGSSGSSAAPKPSKTFTEYCASVSQPYSASSVQGLLTAANQERARLGIARLSWSSSLASAATAWSQQMAANDSATGTVADALAHNPHRPGAENVAMVYSSTGYSQGTAIAKFHVNWMYSAGHCQNIMNPAYTQMGAGVALTDDGTTWYGTQNFR